MASLMELMIKIGAQDNASSIIKGVANTTKSVMKGAAVAVGALATGLSFVTKASVSAYADFEQLTGGVETLFGNGGLTMREYADSVGKSLSEVQGEWRSHLAAQNDVLKNAENAYKNSGLSTNEYIETVTGFSAALIASLGGDTKRAASLADLAVTDMADNANKMGSSMESIQNAYQGFAKQNYTMLDNLKLGYGGTKQEMERLLKDASKLTGKKFDIKNYSDVVEAIHAIQTQMGITGTTALEAEKTISGSVNMMKASWQNWLTGLGNSEADMKKLTTNLISSAKTVLTNVKPIVQQVISSLSEAITEYAPDIISEFVGFITDNLPDLISTGMELLNGILDGILSNAPQIVSAGIDIVLRLAQGLVEGIPTLISKIPEIFRVIIDAIKAKLPEIKEAGLQILQTIQDALNERGINIDFGELFESVKAFGEVLMKYMPVIVQFAATIGTFKAGLKIIDIFSKMKTALMAVGSGFHAVWAVMAANPILLIVAVIAGLVAAIVYLWTTNEEFRNKVISVWEAVKSAVSGAVSAIVGFFQSIGEAITAVGEWFAELPGKIAEKASDMYKAAVTFVQAFIDSARTKFEEMVSLITEWIQSNIIEPAKSAVSGIADAGTKLVEDLKNAINNAWNGLVSWFDGLWNSLFSRGGNFSIGVSTSGGGHAIGLDYVPHNDFMARLHQGEAVLTRSEAEDWRRGNNGNKSGITIVQNISAVPQTPVQLASATAAYFEQARWAM